MGGHKSSGADEDRSSRDRFVTETAICGSMLYPYSTWSNSHVFLTLFSPSGSELNLLNVVLP